MLWSETSSFTSYGEYAAFNEVIQADNGNYYATINMVAGLANFKGYTFQYSGQYLLRLDTSHSVVWSKYLDYAAESFSYFSDLKIAGDTIFMKEYYHPPHGGGSNSLHIWHPDGTTYGFGLGDADGAGYDISNGRIYYVRSFNSPEDSTDTSHFVVGVAAFDGVKQFEKIISSAQVCWASDLIYTADDQIYVTAEESFNAAFVAKLTLGPVNGLSEINMQADISLFPNPATDFVKIQSSSGMKQSIQFINELGQSVLYREFDKSTDHCINVSKLPRGTYFVRIVSNSHAGVKRVILR